MAANDEVETVGKNFSYAVITWEISNISLVMCQPEYNLFSPDFPIAGPVRSVWALYILTRHEKNEMVFGLGMTDLRSKIFIAPDTEKKEFKVNVIANILDANGEHAWVAEREFKVRLSEKIPVETFELSEVFKILPQVGPDCLIIRCYMLVDFGFDPVMKSPIAPGIQCLSRELWNLPIGSFFSDIKFIRGEKCFNLHKDMLLNRGSGLAALIMNHGKNDVVKLLNYDDRSLLPVFQYLYSGDLFFIYEDPRIMIYDIVERFKIPELKYSYPKEKIKLESILVGQEFSSKWNIEHFDVLELPLASEFRAGMESVWQIHVHPKGPSNANCQQKNFVVMKATLLQSRQMIVDACIEFTCVNEKESVLYGRRVQGRMKPGDSRSVEFFLRGGTLMKRCLVNKTLLLRFNVRVFTGKISSGVSSICPPEPYDFDNARSMVHFSQCMKCIFQKPLHPDIIVCNETMGIKAHQFLLGSRSQIFFGRLNPGKDVLSIPTVNSDILKLLLEYLYTGLLPDLSPEIMLCLYEMGYIFDVPSLKTLSSDFPMFNSDNVLHALEVADDRELDEMKREAFQTIALVGPTFVEHKTFEPFQNRRPELAKDVMDFLHETFSSVKKKIISKKKFELMNF